jgi:threonine/homoserine/homoserine lactone efflux protein
VNGLSEFLLTSLIIELTPGPNMAYLAALALSRGRGVAFAAVAGVACGLMLLGLLAAAGLQGLILASPWLYQTIRTAGFLYLLWLAWETWQPPRRPADGSDILDGFWRGLITNLLNPKAGLFYVAVLPTFLKPADGGVAVQSALLAAVYVAIATAVHLAIVVFASAAGTMLAAEARIRTVRRCLAIALVGVAVWFVWKT